NRLLAQFEIANNTVKQETAVGGNPNDALDERDTLLKQISEIVGVTSIRRENDDLALYTSDGTVLFETIARDVTFVPTSVHGAAPVGNRISIDGVALKPGVRPDTSAQGSLQGLPQLRDEIAPLYQSQLDEVARGLIYAFSEEDPNPPGDRVQGLFIGSAVATVTDSGVVEQGLAGTIKVNPLVIPPGGDPNMIRDGIN